MKNNPYFEELFQGFNKEQAFDQLAELFYDRNFSTATKAEVELLMFSIYLDAMLAKHKDPSTGVIDFKECSDYNIAQHLGVTQERVKTLKIKKQIRYPVKYEWEKAFEALKDNIRYDQQKKRIVIPVPDPNLYLDIKKCIEDSGGYIEVQRSANFIQIRPEYYIFLVFEKCDDKQKDALLKQITKELKKKNQKEEVSIQSRQDMINHILGIGENSLSILANLIGVIDSPLLIALKGLKNTFLNVIKEANNL